MDTLKPLIMANLILIYLSQFHSRQYTPVLQLNPETHKNWLLCAFLFDNIAELVERKSNDVVGMFINKIDW